MLHRIHVTGIFTYMKTIKNSTIHGKYTSPMDPMGTDLVVKKQMHWKKAKLGNSAEWLFLGWLSQVTPSMGPPTIEGSKGHGLNYPQNMYFFGLFGCFLNWWYPQNTPKLTFLVEKTHVLPVVSRNLWAILCFSLFRFLPSSSPSNSFP